MTEGTAIFAIIFGLIAIVLGIVSKTFFLSSLYGALSSGRQIAKWKGRLFSIIIGIVALLIGIQHFVFGK
jgi:hypothetical protein